MGPGGPRGGRVHYFYKIDNAKHYLISKWAIPNFFCTKLSIFTNEVKLSAVSNCPPTNLSSLSQWLNKIDCRDASASKKSSIKVWLASKNQKLKMGLSSLFNPMQNKWELPRTFIQKFYFLATWWRSSDEGLFVIGVDILHFHDRFIDFASIRSEKMKSKSNLNQTCSRCRSSDSHQLLVRWINCSWLPYSTDSYFHDFLFVFVRRVGGGNPPCRE